MRRSILVAAVLLISAAGPCQSHGQCVPSIQHSLRTEVFSSIAVIEPAGPAGSELYLVEDGERVVATLRDYHGGPVPEETKLRGALTESEAAGFAPATCQVRLRGKDKQGQVDIVGEITVARFRGLVTRYIGKKAYSYRISLKRQVQQHEYSVGAL